MKIRGKKWVKLKTIKGSEEKGVEKIFQNVK